MIRCKRAKFTTKCGMIKSVVVPPWLGPRNAAKRSFSNLKPATSKKGTGLTRQLNRVVKEDSKSKEGISRILLRNILYQNKGIHEETHESTRKLVNEALYPNGN